MRLHSMFYVRKAILEDAFVLVDLMAQLGYEIGLPVLKENLRKYLQDPDRAVFAALVDEAIVGCIALDMAETFHRNGKHMKVVSLVADRLHRRKGIGKLLLRTAEEWAAERGCWMIEVTSSFHRKKDGSHDFYTSRGYLKGASEYFRKLIEIC